MVSANEITELEKLGYKMIKEYKMKNYFNIDEELVNELHVQQNELAEAVEN